MNTETPTYRAGPILVTDDNRDIVDSLAILLHEAGYQVLSAYSAREALDRLDEFMNVSAVISDVRMPETDGFDFLRVVRHRFPKMRVILMTGHPITDEDMVPIGSTILTKPVEFDMLNRLLELPA